MLATQSGLASEPSQPVVVASSPGRYYQPGLDVLRFFAFLLVYLTHTLPIKGNAPLIHEFKASLTFGVPVFFLLSSFLITELLLREKQKTGRISIRAFYIRRVLRIWPLYFLVLFGGYILCHVAHCGQFSSTSLWAFVFLVGNLHEASHGLLPVGLAVLWSLNVEEQFYLLWPTMIALTGRKHLLVVCSILWMVSQVSFVFAWRMHLAVFPNLYMQSLTYLQFFALGAILSVLLNGRMPQNGLWSRLIMALVGVSLFFVADIRFHVLSGLTTPLTCMGYLVISIGCVLIFLAFLGLNINNTFKPFVYLGKISYGLYVYHWSVFILLTYLTQDVLKIPHHDTLSFLLSMPFAIGIASFSYHFIEKPFLRLKERFEIVRSRAV